MEETDPLPCHGVFIAACDVENAISYCRQIGLYAHEAMIAIDDNPRTFGLCERRQPLQVGDDRPRVEQHMAGKDEVEITCLCGGGQFVRRYSGENCFPSLYPTGHLPAKAVKLAIGGQHPHRPFWNGGKDTDEKVVRVWREGNRRWIGQAQFARDVALRLTPNRPHDVAPFQVRHTGRIFPSRRLTIETGIGPQMVAVRCKMQPVRIGRERAGEEVFVGHNSVLNDQSSGNARLPSVPCK